MNDKVTIKIPRQLYVTEYIVFILRELVADKSIKGNNLTIGELENIKRRLQNLGYM